MVASMRPLYSGTRKTPWPEDGAGALLHLTKVRLPFPERIPLDKAAVFALILCALQLLQGTALYFSVGCLVFIMLAALAFNLAGGLGRPSGAYIFFFATLDVIIGICYKAVLWEPAQTNLLDPETTIKVYVGGMAGMLVAAMVSKRFSRKTGLLQNILKEEVMYRSTVGCIVFSIASPYLLYLLGSARLGSAFNQLNQLSALAILIGVIYEVRRSGGTRSVNLPVAFALVYTFTFYGLLGFSKQGLLTPLFCWFLCVCAMRYRLTPLQIAGGLVWLLIVFEILVPYSQYGRRFVTQSPTTELRIQVATQLLSAPLDMRAKYKEGEAAGAAMYYNTPQGFWDRLNFIGPDDALINVTDQGHTFGYLPVIASFTNVVPRVFMPNKIAYSFGNMYAHEIGGISEDDTTTGISFSPTSEAYHMGRWIGLLVVAPLIWTFVFIVLDSLVGDTRATPWGLLCLTLLSHAAPETGLEGAVYIATYGAEILTFSALFSTWVAPLVSISILGNKKTITPLMPLPPRPMRDSLVTVGRSAE